MCPPKYFVKLLLVPCFVLTTAIQVCAKTTTSTTELSLNPVTPGSTTPRECLMRNGKKGICALEKYCTKEHVIPLYGIIDDSELREKTVCGEYEWCCELGDDDSEETNTPKSPNAPVKTVNNGIVNGKTQLKEGDRELFTICAEPSVGKIDSLLSAFVFRGTSKDIKETGLYCMGSMIGPKVILTSASCLLAAKNITIWAQVPTSVNPKAKYSVSNKILHPNYSSGTHEFDYGLVILNDDVNWGQKNWKGACLGLQAAVDGECIGFGFDEDDQIVSTLLISTPGGCSESGNTSDVVCSRKTTREKYCNIVSGSPVVCSGNGDVRGVARSSCSGDAALVGSLFLSKDWITTELKTLNVLPNDYIKS